MTSARLGLCILVLAGLGPACTVDLHDLEPFPCAENGNCPQGFACVDTHCTSKAFNLTGTWTGHYVTDSGVVTEPDDLSYFTFQALVPDGIGGYTTIDGSGDSDGTFGVPGVANGKYLLSVQPYEGARTYYFALTSPTVQLNHTNLGRPDAVPPTSETDLVFNLTGLAPWDGDIDNLEFFVTNNGGILFAPQTVASSGAPAAQATTIAGMTVDCDKIAFPLVDSSRGDMAMITQLVGGLTADGYHYRALGKASRVDPFTQANGQTTTLTVNLNDAPTPKSLKVTWDPALPASLTSSVSGNATPSIAAVSLSLVPGGASLNYQPAGGGPDLFVLYNTTGATISTTVPYADPEPSSWGRIVSGIYRYTVPFTADGATSSAPLYIAWTTVQVLDPSASEVTVPSGIGVVKSPAINGQSLLGNVSGIGTPIRVSWQAPVNSDANTAYEMDVVQILNSGGNTTFQYLATFLTNETEIDVPDGVLTAGSVYAVGITAASAGWNPAAGKFLSGLEGSATGFLSGTIHP